MLPHLKGRPCSLVRGPEGVGVASGRAIRASLVAIASADMVLTIAMWGIDTDIGFAG